MKKNLVKMRTYVHFKFTSLCLYNEIIQSFLLGAKSDLHIIIFDEIDSIAKVSTDATFAPSKCC